MDYSVYTCTCMHVPTYMYTVLALSALLILICHVMQTTFQHAASVRPVLCIYIQYTSTYAHTTHESWLIMSQQLHNISSRFLEIHQLL